MSDRGRSPEEIEAAIDRRQGELAEDLEDLEYRLSRRGVKDQAKERVSTAREEVTDRASELREQAYQQVQNVRSEASQKMDSWSRELTSTAKRKPVTTGLLASAVMAGLGALIATSGRRSSRPAPKTRRAAMVAWLNDAYANERAIVPVLRNHIRDAHSQPIARERLEQHLAATERHAEQVKGCIERLGGKVSSAKGAAGNLLGNVQAVSTEPAKDELVKNALADYATEQFEIASYRALISGAEEMGDVQTATTCREILADEEAMARWWEGQIPLLTRQHLSSLAEEPVAAAKRRSAIAG